MRCAMQRRTESQRLALALWFLLALCLSRSSAVRAEPPPNPASAHASTTVQSVPTISYEQQRVNHVLAEQKFDLEPAPEGKRIAFVRIVRDDVFVKDEIWPLWP